MKIVDVRTTALIGKLNGFSENRYFYPDPLGRGIFFFSHRAFMFVEVITDEGLVGIGTHCHSLPPKLFKAAVEDLKDLIVGEDPFFIERIWEKIYHATIRYGRRGVVIGALSAIDIALWDLMGKSLNIPLYKLLGGYRSEIPVYASGGYFREENDIENLVDEVTEWVSQGYTAVKFKIGALDAAHDLDRVKAVRDAVGPKIKLIVDSVGGYPSTKSAKRMALSLEDYDIYWFEEPVPPDHVDGLHEVRCASNTPIAGGETEYTRFGFKKLIDSRAVDIVMPDAAICGGVTEIKKIAAMADAHEMLIVPHRSTEVHMHILGSIPNGLIIESFPLETQLWDVMFKEPIEVKNGYITLPDRPGLGIEFDQKAIQKFVL